MEMVWFVALKQKGNYGYPTPFLHHQNNSFSTKFTVVASNLFQVSPIQLFLFCIQMCLFGRERERARCAVERIGVVGFDGDRLWWQWLLWVDATKVNIKFYSLGFY